MSAFTRLHADLWVWEPFMRLPAEAKVLWLALYTSHAARRCPPGLWHGSIMIMADAARMQPDETARALDTLIEHEMLEFDNTKMVARLTAPKPHTPLPDAGEWAHNGRAVKGWWTKFNTIPSCAVRDAHVPTLRWLIEEGSRQSKSRQVTGDHEIAWRETFASVQIPVPRKRGVQRVLSDDTSTYNQPSLFAPPKASPSAASVHVDTVKVSPAGSDSSTGVSFSQNPMISISGIPYRDCQGSETETLRSSSLGSETRTSHEASGRSPTGGAVLRLVPMPEREPEGAPFTADQMLASIRETAGEIVPPVLTQTRRLAFCRAISVLTQHDLGLADLRALGAFLAAHAATVSGWLAWIDKGDMLEAVVEARSWYSNHGIAPKSAEVAPAS